MKDFTSTCKTHDASETCTNNRPPQIDFIGYTIGMCTALHAVGVMAFRGEEQDRPNEGPKGPNEGPKGPNEGPDRPNEGPTALRTVWSVERGMCGVWSVECGLGRGHLIAM
jgi:hypothetical protein